MDIKINLKDEFPFSNKEYSTTNQLQKVSLRVGIDRLLFRYGLGIIVIPVFSNKSNKILGYQAKMKIYPNNYWHAESEEILVVEDFRSNKNLLKTEKTVTLFALNYLEEKLKIDGINYPKKEGLES